MKFRRILLILAALLIFALPAQAANPEKEYNQAVELLQKGKLAEAADKFASIGHYEDASMMAMYCAALDAGESGLYATAVANFETLGSFRDSALQARYYAACFYETIEDYEEADELLSGMSLFRDAGARLITYPGKINARDYARAEAAEEAGNLETALSRFVALGSYSDSADRAEAVREKIRARDYAAADALEQAGKLEEALKAFQALGDYSDCADRVASVQEKIRARDYAAADALEQENKLEEALKAFQALGDYSNCADRVATVQEKIRARDYAAADAAEQAGDYTTAYNGFVALGDYSNSAARAANVQDRANYALGLQYANNGKFSKAYEIFAALGDYEDSAEKAYALGVTTFASVSDRGNGVAAFKFHDLWGIINVNTNTTVSPYWNEIGTFNDLGLARVCKNNLYGYINTQGQVVIPCEWYSVSEFSGNLCTVAATAPSTNSSSKNNYLYGLYDNEGNMVSEPQWRTLGTAYNTYWNPGSWDNNYCRAYAPAFSDGKIKVQNASGLWGFIDEAGQLVGEVKWSSIADFSEGLATVVSNERYGFIDGNGNVVIEPQYAFANSFYEGLAAVRNGNYYNYIDMDNNLVIQANYTDYNNFSGGKADVFLENVGWQIIDKEGKLLYFINEQTVADYEAAMGKMSNGEYTAAAEIFNSLSGYRDSNELAAQCTALIPEENYLNACAKLEAGDVQTALGMFSALDDYRDAKAKADECIAKGATLQNYSVASSGTYGFALNRSGYYESQNKGYHGTTAACTVTVQTGTGKVYLDVINYAESGYDYGTIYALDSTSKTLYNLSSSSYNKSTVQTFEIPVADSKPHTIRIEFRKDGSSSSYNDSLQFKVRFD